MLLLLLLLLLWSSLLLLLPQWFVNFFFFFASVSSVFHFVTSINIEPAPYTQCAMSREKGLLHYFTEGIYVWIFYVTSWRGATKGSHLSMAVVTVAASWTGCIRCPKEKLSPTALKTDTHFRFVCSYLHRNVNDKLQRKEYLTMCSILLHNHVFKYNILFNPSEI